VLALDHLNPPQREAVLHVEGPLVVFAGAGSGKTRVITHRVAHLVGDLGVAPWSILAVTFTNKAAGEMRERLAALVPGAAAGLWVGTFHATCARLLRAHHEAIGLRRDFTIYDAQDQLAMVKRVVGDLRLDPERFSEKNVAQRINTAKQEVRGPDQIQAIDPWTRGVQQIYEAYEEAMRRAGALDFGDLIYRLVVALERDDALRRQIAGRFRYVLVDEFQDTNHAQLRLVRALCAVHRNLCVVGDDDQSIYRWRGADRRNILDFRRDFPEAQVIKLEQNYRSTGSILRAAFGVIRHNVDREPKELWTDNPEGERVLSVQNVDEREEARMVVRGVRELLAGGQSLSEMAVLYRVHAQSRVVEETLRGANLAYRIVGGTRFYDRAEVKDVLAYLRLCQNLDDDVSLLRVLNRPTRGIGKTTVDRMLEHAARRGMGLWPVVSEPEAVEGLRGAAAKKVRAFAELVAGLRELASPPPPQDDGQLSLLGGAVERDGVPLVEVGRAVLERTGYLEMLRAEDSATADARIQNVGELLSSMEQFEAERWDTDEPRDLAAFLEQVTLATQEDETGPGERLTLMTVHAAKGLEFRTVLVIGMEEGLFPFKVGEPGESPDELEEERRLAYVAFTRAQERLVLSHAGRRMLFGRVQFQTPSRFLAEIPDDAIERIGSAPPRPAYHGWDDDPYGSRVAAPSPRGSGGDSYLDTSEGDFEGEAIRLGMRVRHPKFGVGQVCRVSPGVPPRVTVLFDGRAEKTLLASFLEPA